MSHQQKQQMLHVMISSTARDLPEHRKEVMDACLRQGMFPKMMEHLPASDTEAIAASLNLVDEADIYVGVFAHRYGYVPKENNPQQISVTEMEYARAVERKIPRLIFVIDKNLPLADFTINDIDIGESAEKLAQFKSCVETENIVNFFKSPADLRAHVINSLSQLRKPDLATFHYISNIPAPPKAFIAHPYTLLQTHRLVGRQPELKLLTDWVTKPDSEVYEARILSVVAIGGLGKSALTWKWFNDIAPQEMMSLAGRIWWSFYESDATFENFVSRALAYVTGVKLGEVQQIPAPEREAQLLAVLDREQYLVVLDGLERILVAYARMDAAHLIDDDYDSQTANSVTSTIVLPVGVAQSFMGEHLLRKTTDPRAGAFLRKLSGVRAARILISTRLYPADLQIGTGEPLPRCSAALLSGLTDDDSLELWQAFGVTGGRDLLLPLFNCVSNHPLWIQVLASEVARYRRAPGDFDQWQHDHPDFDPFSLPLVQVKSHVMEFALRGLDDKARQVLHIIAAFRMPARYDTLTALLIGEGKACINEHELDKVLTELEDRALVGWDKLANRYDLHPIVRGVVWSGLDDGTRRGVYMSLHAHFEALPTIDDYHNVNSLEDLTSAIELYNTLIGLGRFDDAETFFHERIDEATLYRLSASHQRIQLLGLLFPDGLSELPRLSEPDNQASAFNALAHGYHFSGRPRIAAALYQYQIMIRSEMKDYNNLSIGFHSLSYALRSSGALYESVSAGRHALNAAREQGNRANEAYALMHLGLTLAARGMVSESDLALRRALQIWVAQDNSQSEGVQNSFLAQQALWLDEFDVALSFINRAWELAHIHNHARDFIRIARLQGEIALRLNDFATADERLHYALTNARVVNNIEEELTALVALAELRRRLGDLKAARELLDDVWDVAERGPYSLIHADACNVLAQIERNAGNRAMVVEAATRAYKLAWCDGPPFAYHWGLVSARKYLCELYGVEPEMPAFDESQFGPMPDVDIDPEDEFHAGKNTDK
jgi:tetratricopeptide (TPR) repeat protein